MAIRAEPPTAVTNSDSHPSINITTAAADNEGGTPVVSADGTHATAAVSSHTATSTTTAVDEEYEPVEEYTCS